MAQQPSPSQSLPDGASRAHLHANHNSNPDVPIDPSISQASPTYPPYSPYGAGPGQDGMPQYAQHQAPPYNYDRAPQPGPWPGYPPQHPMPGQYHHPGAVGQPPPTSGPQRPGQVYSFVPIPGAQQHKRPRRRYEEIERMYKCGWNGCEKAYGTLNHLNAHVTMQSHGSKRTPEEFKEIRKEWKARKKEEENARKAEDERARQAHVQAQQQAQHSVEGQGAEHPQGQAYQQNGARPSLPPIGYGNADGQPQGQYAQPMGYPPQGNGNMHYPQYPNSPYGQQQGQVYQQQAQPGHY
ncbi:C2H2 finger domain transcription factor con7 [Lithohypha guttulata]|uniref:C2H2 finger domain transcription factor con7 n=1 Tax=Lithohypha guttulata TaxID=1690604 RepID=A0AAN7Y422_9EURO|nr:C2H2 finger domain transcription factor con7 [Lithohypha guttulata]KAK5081686.1 C2H2 finger domain transcription factor con7 [Lithohypha guttulata]KAK5104991.1 C2H2 finger domain transcription factor con7 [Lithohypha guttulata]